MSFYTDWVLAAESDAEAVASAVTTEVRSLEDWPHLSLRNIGQIDLHALWAILREEPREPRSTAGELLHQESDDGPFVCRVEPEFVEALARVGLQELASIAVQWRQTEGLSGRPGEEIEAALRELCGFAAKAQETQTPILDLLVL